VSRLRIPVTERDHLRGSLRAAAVVLLEYGDYECPHCAAAQPMIDTLSVMLGDRLCVAFRHFPLSQVHPHAQHAAEAAEAADAQSMFWPMHELLFEQRLLDDSSLLEYADELGLDVERFASELRAGVHEPRVREDFMSGVRSGVNGTPAFFINGARYDGSHDLQSLLSALQQAASRKFGAAATSPADHSR
jgi:protein-disulfide isomerase